MIQEKTEFYNWLLDVGISAQKYEALHPAVQRAWQWNYDTLVKFTTFELRRILKTVKGEKE